MPPDGRVRRNKQDNHYERSTVMTLSVQTGTLTRRWKPGCYRSGCHLRMQRRRRRLTARRAPERQRCGCKLWRGRVCWQGTAPVGLGAHSPKIRGPEAPRPQELAPTHEESWVKWTTSWNMLWQAAGRVSQDKMPLMAGMLPPSLGGCRPRSFCALRAQPWHADARHHNAQHG